MSIEQANAYFSDADRASYSKALRELEHTPNSAIIDFGPDPHKWVDGNGLITERYGVRPAGWVRVYAFTAVFGASIDESLRWISPVGPMDDFSEPITDTMYDALTTIPGGPWACMSESSFKTFGSTLGLGVGQKYRLRPDGVWIKVGG